MEEKIWKVKKAACMDGKDVFGLWSLKERAFLRSKNGILVSKDKKATVHAFLKAKEEQDVAEASHEMK
jgi:hypothetical protein